MLSAQAQQWPPRANNTELYVNDEQPQGSYLSPRLLLQQHQQLHQLNQEQFQELQQHHQQVQMRMQHHQQQHHQSLSSLVAVDDEDACSASSSYNSPSGSIANHSLVSNSSDNQLDIAATSSAAAVAAAATAASVTVGSNSNASTSSAASRPSSAAASGQPPHRKRRYKVQMPEADEPFLCHVCGDKALGYNFDAVTCESCKAFFRRNALKKKEQKCNFSGACDVSVNTRKFCSACRLKKCFSVGMKKDWILNETELQQRRAKTRCNRECRSGSTPTRTPPMPTLLSVDQQPQASLAMPVFKLEHNPGCCSSGKCGGGFQPSSGSHCQVPPPPTLLASSSGVTTAAGAAVVSASPPPGVVDGASPAAVGRPSVLAFLREEEPEPAMPRWTDRRPLSPASAAIIDVIRGALDGVMNNVEPQDSDRIRSATNAPVTLEAPFAITLSFVQRFVLFVKRLPEYSLIEQKDMIHLIKGGVFHFILMRGVSIYNPAENTFSFQSNSLGGHHTLSLACLSQSLSVYPNGQALLHRYQRFMVEYHSVSQGDQLALTLLQLIEFYNPARPNLCNMHRVDRIQQGYILLFRRYIQHSFPAQCARRVYFDLMNRLSDLEDLANEFSQLCHIVGFRYEELDPLLIEVFELQQRQRQRMGLATDDDEADEAGVAHGDLKCEPETPRSTY
ncbi:hypothetical protein BOX15_Mlig021298g1 [Macrostomum lignano]|uniref:Nuclear receptor domain-containing protein n=2 Tax=Macrostomum lignano TaxID=282301 RepID=A0A267FVJ7_9PLAT|nr:hypothetical protein BOX15_Mlig021298g1 [Macrostomum lignano]